MYKRSYSLFRPLSHSAGLGGRTRYALVHDGRHFLRVSVSLCESLCVCSSPCEPMWVYVSICQSLEPLRDAVSIFVRLCNPET